MKNNLKFCILFSSVLATVIFSCAKEDSTTAYTLRPELPDQPFNYSLQLPPGFGAVSVDSNIIIDVFFGFSFNQNNPQITDHGATLGRVLFYDPQLSLNNSISCGSCHHQDKAFSDGKAFSTGFAGEVTPRSSMAIINAGFNQNLFWDSRVQNVFQLATKPIQNHIEMGMESMERLKSKLSKIDYYQPLFTNAFGSPEITEEKIGNALSQFVCSITAADSKFDQLALNPNVLTSEERQGMDLFFSARTNCSRCHAAPNFAAPDFVGGEYGGGTIIKDPNGGLLFEDLRGGANNGLTINYNDEGMGKGKFRIPSLRNIALTAPYMHDGRFATLNEVVDHYNSGIVNHPDLDNNLKDANGAPLRMNLNIQEKRALIAFMNSLTDQTTMVDPKWSNPFK